nr:heterodisulfide reductase-related iron-sulfur binding cluster [Candidatus Freyarchaeota archaeon]
MERLDKMKKQIYRCIHCGACRFAYSGEPDRAGIGEHEGTLYEGIVLGCPAGRSKEWEGFYNSGKMWMARAVLEEDLVPDEAMRDIIFQCTTCGNCAAQCENKIPTVDVIEALRATLVEKGIPLGPKTAGLGKNIKEKNNPYNEPHAERTSWFKGKKTKTAKTAYFVGCTGAYRIKNVAEATERLFRKIGEPLAVLEDEVCCGSPLFRTGQIDEALRVMRQNIETFKQYKTVVFSCAGCYRTFKVDYPKYSGKPLPFKPVHTLEYIADLMKQGKLKITKEFNKKVTWHDPCHLTRHIADDIEKRRLEESKNWFMDTRAIEKEKEAWYELPRYVLSQIPGVKFVEMYRIKENTWCCGAGGGVKTQYPELAIDTVKERIKEAEATGAEAIVTSCPFCFLNLRDGIKETGSKLELYELIELLDSLVS